MPPTLRTLRPRGLLLFKQTIALFRKSGERYDIDPLMAAAREALEERLD